MSNAREYILNNIRKALGRSELSPDIEAQLEQRLITHPRGIIPQRDNLNQASLIEFFVEEAKKYGAKTQRINTFSETSYTLLQILKEENAGYAVRASTDPIVSQINWGSVPEISIKTGTACNEDKITVTSCLCGVAETGTLVLVSSPESPSLLNFLPEIHIVVLSTQQIVPAYEDAWDLIRQRKTMPRTVNFITGPSRTADIEQKLLMGVHGPKKLHIILYEEGNS